MWLFEVHDDVRPGFKLHLRQGDVGVSLGYDSAYDNETWLPVGNSIASALRHEEDQELPFKLMRAKFEERNIGFVLTKQTDDEARNERKALVLIDGCTDPGIGVTLIAEAYGRERPELISYAEGKGQLRKLFVFKPGDALFISWPARALGAQAPRRFIISWDGEHLKELPVHRQKWKARPQRRGREAQKELAQASVQQELRP